MSEKEFINQLLSSSSQAELRQCKDKLLMEDTVDKEMIEELFVMIEQEQKSHLDRNAFLTILINYIGTTGNTVSFIMNLLQELLRMDGCTEEAIRYAVKSSYKVARNVREMQIQKEVHEKKQKNLAQLKREEELKKLESTLPSTTEVSYDTARFLIRNGFTYEEIKSKSNLCLISQEDIDPIVHHYRIDSCCEQEMVSIADVVGYDYQWLGGEKDLLKAFPNFFDSNKKDGYHQRALSMLDLTTENAMEKLSYSFQKEPIKLADTLNGQYTINGNGMHRYCILRSLYCIEMIHANGNKEQENRIYEKYKIPAMVTKIDFIKTYANFILTALKVATWVSNEKDSNNHSTGRVKIVLSNNETLFLTDEELLKYVSMLLKNKKYSETINYLRQNANDSFLEFLNLVIPDRTEENVDYVEEKNGKSI